MKLHSRVYFLILDQVEYPIVIPLQIISPLQLVTPHRVVSITDQYLSVRAQSIDTRDHAHKVRPRTLIFLNDSLEEALLSIYEFSSVPFSEMIQDVL